MSKPYYTSDDLIEAVKRNSNFPAAQVTYTDEDILKFANEEMFLSQVPSVMQYHEDFFTFRQNIALTPNNSRYDIPDRAIGLKLHDLFWIDDQGNSREMTFISSGDKAFFETSSPQNNSPFHFYIESNQVVLTPRITSAPRGSLQFIYYMRPNNLVLNNRAAIAQYFTKDLTVDNTTLIVGDTLTIDGLTLTAGTDFAIGATSIATANNINIAINSLYSSPSTVSSNIVTIRYEEMTVTISSSNSAALSIEGLTGIEFDQVPANITNGSKIDFIKSTGGFRTYTFDVKLGKSAVSSDIIKFSSGQIPAEFRVGDYICSQYECIIPQIPADLHTLLAERTVARILKAQGDQEGLNNAKADIGMYEKNQGTLIDNRVEGSPRKILNRNTFLRYNKSTGLNKNNI